jgi:hypothetical protein
VFHGILGLGFDNTLLDPVTGERVKAIDHICSGKELRGLRFVPTQFGLDVQYGAMFPQGVGQGHQDQFIAEMAQWGMPADRKFRVDGKDFTMMDFVRHSQMRARVNAEPKQELSWAIVLIAQYIGTDAAWLCDGQLLHFSTLIQYEVNEPIEASSVACGGTHRLFGLAWAYHYHVKNGGKTEGVWQQLVARLNYYKEKSRNLQNPDGSFSTNYYRGIGNAKDPELRISTTGHTLEWLSLAMTDEELKQEWVQRAADRLAITILDMQSKPIDSGALYHAVHGLKIYHARMFTPHLVGTPAMPIPPPPQATAPKAPSDTPESLLPKR